MSQPTTEVYIDGDTRLSVDAEGPRRLHSYGMTDRGQVRPKNEDQFVIAELARTLLVQQTSLFAVGNQCSEKRGSILIVADGMGGHQAGEVASALSVESLGRFFLNSLKQFVHLEDAGEASLMKEFQEAFNEADSLLAKGTERCPQWEGMGTTLTLVFVVGNSMFVAHAGDSRCYLYSGGRLQQLTHDHTMAEEMVRRGILKPEEAAASRYRNVVTNVLGGTQSGVSVELHRLALEPSDVILLCSDGLTGMVSDERIAQILAEQGDPKACCEQLIKEANLRGGKDNITAIVAKFE
jgi:PPM family protein phosphatase